MQNPDKKRSPLSDVIRRIKSGESEKKEDIGEAGVDAGDTIPVDQTGEDIRPNSQPSGLSDEDALADMIKGDISSDNGGGNGDSPGLGGLIGRLGGKRNEDIEPEADREPIRPFLNTVAEVTKVEETKPKDQSTGSESSQPPEEEQAAIPSTPQDDSADEGPLSEEKGESTEAHKKLSSLITKIRTFEDQGQEEEESALKTSKEPAVEEAFPGEEDAEPTEELPRTEHIKPETVQDGGDIPDEIPDTAGEDLRSVIDDIVRSHDEAASAEQQTRESSTLAPIDFDEDDLTAEEESSSATLDEDVLAAKKTLWSGEEHQADKTMVSVDDLSVYGDLILPQGAVFEVEELHLASSASAFDMVDKGTVLSEIDEIWKPGFPSVNLGEAEFAGIDESLEETRQEGRLGIFKRISIKKPLVEKVPEYNPRVHGPLVDLTMKPVQGHEEVELYPVNEPYAYIRIVYDNNNHEHLYQVIEPILSNAEQELLKELQERLFETLDVNTKDMTRETAREALRGAVDGIIHDYGIKLSPPSREKILYHIEKQFLGDGLIDPIMHDKYIEDISCDGLNTPIFVYHTGYESTQTDLMYSNPVALDSFVTRLAQRAGKYISIAEPMLDATMSDGSRIQMTLGTEVTAHGSTFTIRKFREEPITPTDLIEWSTFSPLSIAFIWLAVENGKSIIFAGGTASGKTTSLNAISLFIPPLAKIVSLEDTRELKLPHPNWIPSITRESFDTDGKGSIDMYELLRAALRQRPEYILVGEVRGHEALTLFQAMSTGHVTYATMHADSVASVVHRLENPPLNVPRNMLNALDLVSVQVQARIGGQRIRRNKQLIEILDIDPRTNELITNEVFKWYPATDEIRYSGKSYILEEIMEERGWSEARMREELKRRQEILEWMRLKKLRHFTDVSKVLISYFRDPEAVMDIVRSDLYE